MKDRRLFFKTGLSTLYVPYYEKLCERMGPDWQPYSGFRDFRAQDGLYAQGRTTNIGAGNILTNAKGGQSPHNYGCATDWTIFEEGKPVWMKKSDPRWKELIDAVVSVGLRSGADFGDVDHNELKLTCDWPHIYLAYQQNGMTGAQNKLSESLG